MRSGSDACPKLVTSGFVALDVILGQPPRVAAGGTAANVAAATASFGWDARVVGTLGDDAAGRYIQTDLISAGVDVDDLRLLSAWTTPVVLQESVGDDHVWRFICPECGNRFAKHRPSPAAQAYDLISKMPAPDVFFFDRTSLYTLALAERWRSAGAIVVFEPSGLGRSHLFDRAITLAHVIKYSSQRANAFEERLDTSRATLVRTEGAAGASFRVAGDGRWHFSAPAPLYAEVDTAGAGDWTTAGLLNALMRHGVSHEISDRTRDVTLLSVALAEAQQWGAKACGWQGARPIVAPGAAPAARVPNLYCGVS
jgi:fructokinase